MSLFLTETSTAAGGSSMIVMLVLMFAIFYFFIIRPENKKRKKPKPVNYTKIAITGLLFHYKPKNVTVEDRVRLQVKKWAISTTAKMEAAEAEAKKGKRK